VIQQYCSNHDLSYGVLVLGAINFPCRIAQQLFGNGNDSANIGKCFNSNKTLWIVGTFGIEHFGWGGIKSA